MTASTHHIGNCSAPRAPLPMLLAVLVCLGGGASPAGAQQITIPRIEQMPRTPAPYLMRDWRGVARAYDSLAFDPDRTGTHLPLVTLSSGGINYPLHGSFLLHTVVGTTDPNSSEAINALPAIVGATLSGVDKSDQGGRNWVLMAEEWFNRRPSQNVYKNHPVDDGGDDWWYATMPNVFFYQMNDLYPHTGDFEYQFTSVAERWLEALGAMGAGSAPWQVPDMDHRGWFLQTMTPHDDGVHEPEAAGAIAWLLYSAYANTGDARYRIGAEQAMEFLNSRTSNPAYELQLAYGTYLAARMNGELGTSYDIEKMVNWCFNVGPLRSWGAMTGAWGGYDVSGLIGEVNGVNNYAFAMNTFEQVGCLVPMVRYDPRFARAVGKWVLNAANAARLFYPKYLPEDRQDSYQWSVQFDPASSVAHEALRQSQSGGSPYGTGDAIIGGWGATNLALYGSSHAGILGGIVETTDVPMVLKLDLLATDYYRAPAYPSYLFYNPHDSARLVAFDAGAGAHDLYDAVSKSTLQTGVTGVTLIPLPADAARLVVVIPAGGVAAFDEDRLLVDGVTVDYRSGAPAANHAPRIKSLAAERSPIAFADTVGVHATAADADGDPLTYTWQAARGAILGSGASVELVGPATAGADTVTCTVSDGAGGERADTVIVVIVAALNAEPVILDLTARPRKIDLGASSGLRCTASDADGDTLSFSWSAAEGSLSGAGDSVTWTAPALPGNYVIRSSVDDGRGGSATDSIGLEVRDFSQPQTGELVAYYPFTGNAADSSGSGNHGTLHGALAAPDRAGTPAAAYLFNGATDDIQVPNSPSLSFQQAVTLNFWITIGAFFLREQYPLSHGNYQNRWKVSISDRHLRWTVRTDAGIKDLDSETELVTNRWYNATVLYSGADVEIYLDGVLDAFGTWSGTIPLASIDLTIGQASPAESGYNFQGRLDEIRIYNYALSTAQIEGLASGTTAAGGDGPAAVPSAFSLGQNYPNPFNPSTTIGYGLPARGRVTLLVYDVLGRIVRTLVDETQNAGFRSVAFHAGDIPSGVYFYQLRSAAGHLTRKFLYLR